MSMCICVREAVCVGVGEDPQTLYASQAEGGWGGASRVEGEPHNRREQQVSLLDGGSLHSVGGRIKSLYHGAVRCLPCCLLDTCYRLCAVLGDSPVQVGYCPPPSSLSQ